ncbi:MAG: DUF2167 domain-containing protein [Dokdonella sp.]
MFTVIYLLGMLPILAALFYLLSVARVWRTDRTLAIVMLLFWPAGLYALVRYWGEEENNIRVPMVASLGTLAIWCGMLAWGIGHVSEHDRSAAFADAPDEDDPAASKADEKTDDKLHFSIALAKLPLRSGRIEIAPAHAAIEVPTHFHFIDRASLQTLYADADNGPGDHSIGWLVHESVNLANDDAWFVEITWLDDGYVAENDLGTRARDILLAEAQRATVQQSAQQGDIGSFSLARYAEEPAFDARRHSVTWVEDVAYSGQREHKLDCYAATLGRSGAFLYSINGISMQRQELCLRSVRLTSARTEFASGHTYADHSGLFDHKAKYDLTALVTGAYASKH